MLGSKIFVGYFGSFLGVYEYKINEDCWVSDQGIEHKQHSRIGAMGCAIDDVHVLFGGGCYGRTYSANHVELLRLKSITMLPSYNDIIAPSLSCLLYTSDAADE